MDNSRHAAGNIPAMHHLAFAACFVAATAFADPAVTPDRHLVYVELMGKAGAYGVGYEYTLRDRLSVGAAGSFFVADGQQIWTGVPYVHGTLLAHGHHAWFSEIGAILSRSRIASPVAD
jgi:hypothetical protein